MNELNVTAGDVLHKVYVIGGQEDVPQRVLVERDARADILVAVLPGVSCDISMAVELLGEGAQANVYGAYVCGADEKVRIAVDMYHNVPHCCSRQLFKGIAGGVSRVDFYGKITVAQDAQRTEAYQENHNLLLSDGAGAPVDPGPPGPADGQRRGVSDPEGPRRSHDDQNRHPPAYPLLCPLSGPSEGHGAE